MDAVGCDRRGKEMDRLTRMRSGGPGLMYVYVRSITLMHTYIDRVVCCVDHNTNTTCPRSPACASVCECACLLCFFFWSLFSQHNCARGSYWIHLYNCWTIAAVADVVAVAVAATLFFFVPCIQLAHILFPTTVLEPVRERFSGLLLFLLFIFRSLAVRLSWRETRILPSHIQAQQHGSTRMVYDRNSSTYLHTHFLLDLSFLFVCCVFVCFSGCG